MHQEPSLFHRESKLSVLLVWVGRAIPEEQGTREEQVILAEMGLAVGAEKVQTPQPFATALKIQNWLRLVCPVVKVVQQTLPRFRLDLLEILEIQVALEILEQQGILE
jgi:hypothetical protein